MTLEEAYQMGYRCASIIMPDVVRCKDCRFYTEPDSHGDRCDRIHWSMGDDWFCADGKRRDDDE